MILTTSTLFMAAAGRRPEPKVYDIPPVMSFEPRWPRLRRWTSRRIQGGRVPGAVSSVQCPEEAWPGV